MSKNSIAKIPTDLSGVTTAQYEWPRHDKSHKSAVGIACDSIREVIRDLGISEVKTAQQVHDIRARQESTESQLRTLQIVTKAGPCTMDPEAMGSPLQQVAAAFESRTRDPRSNDSERRTADQSTLHSKSVSHHR